MGKWEPKIHIPDELLEENERWNKLEQELADVKAELRLTLDALRTKDIELYDLKALVGEYSVTQGEKRRQALWVRLMQAIKEE